MPFLRFLIILLYVAALTFLSWYINGESLLGIDDANIYLVYMRNFANGHGFVFNIGGERVEGFTSLMWTLIGSLFFFISYHPEKLLLLVNIIAIAYTLYSITQYIGANNKNKNLLFDQKSIFFLAVIGTMPGFIDWTVLSLMETGIWCTLLTITSLHIIRYDYTSKKTKYYLILSFLFILLIICRPESLLWVPIFIFLNALKGYFYNETRSFLKELLILSCVYLISISILFVWRLDYFGYLLPNTYYAKISQSIRNNFISGIYYLYNLFIQKPIVLFIFIHLNIFILKKIPIKKNIYLGSILLLYIIFGISLIIPLYSGGDHFSLHRFIIPAFPVIFLAWVLVLNPNWFRYFMIPFLILMSIFFSNSFNFKEIWVQGSYPLRYEWELAEKQRNNSVLLNKFFNDHKTLPTQGVWVAGGSAFAYKGNSIDLLGLNNTKMAHADKIKDKNLPKNHGSFNVNVFFDLNPDLFWYYNCAFLNFKEPVIQENKIDQGQWISRIFKHIQSDKRFIENYGFYRIFKRDNHTESLQIFAHKKFISYLDTSIYKTISIKYE